MLWAKFLGLFIGVAYAAPAALPSSTYESDKEKLLIWVLAMMGGILYAIGAYAIVNALTRMRQHDLDIAVMKQKCQDTHKN